MKSRKRKVISLTIVGVFLISILSGGVWFLIRSRYPKIIKPLPDPFIFNNETRVSTQQDWENRREEIKTILLDIEYGTIPGDPEMINASKIQSESLENGTKDTIILKITPFISTPSISFNMTIWVYTPNKTGPYPTLIKVSPDGTGSQVPIADYILNRGYMFVCYNHTDIEPDTQGYDVVGPAQAAYPTYTWGSLGVWAWGASRVVDYLTNESFVNTPDGTPDVDPSKLIITGHSRRGKTALLAGAMDGRFAMVAPNGSGTGGTGSFLVQGPISESLQSITSTRKFKSWFKEDFSEFGGNEKNLSFDQHFLCALVAPRILLSTNGLGDYWCNPTGTQTIYKATKIVFEFFGKEEKCGLHFRKGKHGFKQEDFTVLLDFADFHLMGKNITGDFYMTPYPFESPIEFTAP